MGWKSNLGLGVGSLAAAVVAGVTPVAAAPNLASMTLQESDLPAQFSQHVSHSIPSLQVRALQGTLVPRYLAAWQREFTRLQGLNTAAVTSSVLRYGSPVKAHDAFAQIWKQVGKQTGAKPFKAGVGSESRAFTYPKGPVAAYAVVWRHKNLVALVLSLGVTALGTTQQSTKALALKQQTHMKAG